MRNILVEVEYDGTSYSGWQIQSSTVHSPQKKTIQETIEKTLQKILQEKIKLIGSGRTDAGVHARGQIANFKTNTKLHLEKIQKALNSLLPNDIVIRKIKEVSPDFNSRYCAKSKIYRYAILNRNYPSAFVGSYALHYPYKLNISLMKKQARLLLGRHNFKSFQAANSSVTNTVRTIKKLKITKKNVYIYFDIEADGFLYKMVRSIVGTLVEIGRGKPVSIVKILSSHDRRAAGPSAPACGLTLLEVKYGKKF